MARFLQEYKLALGLSADVLTFGGGLLLGRDAFRHLAELRQHQLEEAFRRRFPQISSRMADTSEADAKVASKVAIRGLILLIAGFGCEILTRFAE